MVSPKKKNVKDKHQPSSVSSPSDSPSFQEPSTPEGQTAYSLALESTRRSRTRTRTKSLPKINVNESNKKGQQLSPISGRRIATQRSDSSSPSSSTVDRRPDVAKKSTRSVLQPQKKSNIQRPGTSSQRNNSSDTSNHRTPSPRKRRERQNVENIDPQPGTSRAARQAADNINPQPGTSRAARQAAENINPQPGTSRAARQAAENINPQPGSSRGVVRNPPVLPVNKRKKKTPTKFAAMREIHKLQSSTNYLIPKLPFSRLIREILQACSLTVSRITPPALIALQESSEMYITHLLADSYRCTIHRARVTLTAKDIQLARYLRGAADS